MVPNLSNLHNKHLYPAYDMSLMLPFTYFFILRSRLIEQLLFGVCSLVAEGMVREMVEAWNAFKELF